ncbi:MAG: hypothetical protein ABUL62_17275 [Myxococcales bacterium]|jgi:hypothetical protein
MKLVPLIALSTTLALGGAASAAQPALTAELTCQRAAGPGRLLCELSTQARTGKLVWSDALVVRAPEFARPLRSRFVAQLDSSGVPRASAKLALVANAAGRGKLELLARGVVCSEGPGGEWCGPEVAPVTALIEVDPVTSNGPSAP